MIFWSYPPLPVIEQADHHFSYEYRKQQEGNPEKKKLAKSSPPIKTEIKDPKSPKKTTKASARTRAAGDKKAGAKTKGQSYNLQGGLW